MEAYVWACTDTHLGVCLSTRVFASPAEAQEDAQEAIGDACPIDWTKADDDMCLGEFVDTNGCRGHVTVALVKVRL